MKKTLRNTLLTWFLSFSVIATIVFLISNTIYNHQKTRITDLIGSIYDLHLDVQKDFNLADAFFTYEASNVAFFETSDSRLLNEHQLRLDEIRSEIRMVEDDGLINKLKIRDAIDSLKTEINYYNLLLNQVTELTLERGFKDAGTVGEMRSYIHQLEDYSRLDQIYVLLLRRHEKDYIIRGQQQYVDNLNSLSSEFAKEINSDPAIPAEMQKEIISILNNYVAQFNKLVDLDRRIGRKTPPSGKMGELSSLESQIEGRFNTIIEEAESRKVILFRYIELFYGSFFILFLLITAMVSRRLSRTISAPLTILTNHIKQLSGNKLELDENLDQNFRNYESSVLFQEFRILIEQIKQEQDDLNRAKSALVDNEEKYRALANHLPQAVFETDHFGNISYVNTHWLKNLKYSQEEIDAGLNIIHILKAEEGPLILGDESRGASEYTAIRSDGSNFPALVYTNRINRNNKLLGFRGVIIDITERKHRMDRLKEEKEKAEQADKLKSTFLANMSHEIRTPMNAIIGFSNLLGNKELSKKEREEYLNHIQGSGQSLLKLIDDIIDISRIEAGEITIRKQDFHIKEIFEELFLTISERLQKAGKKKIKLSYHIPEGLERYAISSDPFRLRQVLINLLSNAVKFTLKGEIKYGFEIKEDNVLQFYVEDSGIGMGKTEQVDAFDRFVQIRNNLNEKQEGTGLGLAISKNLVELLGGKLWVNSEIGKGSIFSFTITANPVELEESNSTKKIIQLDETNFDFKGKTILVAEDDDNNFIYLNAVLSRTKASVIRGYNGQDSVDLVKTKPDIDLVMMDLQMPVMDGYEAIKLIKSLRSDLPVISQTAHVMQKEREKIQKHGFDDYILKPINENELLNKIAFQLRKVPV